ncbi:Protein kinase domain [Trypanosoma melophagium]|uniref:Protein kinase domain n=1 Tax=Trypanosoma melophagium TaxID=715481 RepID=UPI003519FD47|nr:Protein kinase domain [Trypanosoma melophagium]
MLSGLAAVRSVDAVVVDRMRWWRTRRETRTISTTTTKTLTPISTTLATTTTKATIVPRRQRSHTAPLQKVSSHSPSSPSSHHHHHHSHNVDDGGLRKPPRTVIAVRNPKLLVFVRGEATAEHRDAVQMALRETDGDVWLTQLLNTERDFYSTQLRPYRNSGRSRYSLLRERSRRRAASVPALPAITLNLQTGRRNNNNNNNRSSNVRKKKEGRTNSSRSKSRDVSQTSVRRGIAANNKEKVALPSILRPAHQCRRVECLQDSYVFHPEADFVGDGAFSRVFRAMPIFRGAPSDTFYAIKVIPRRRWRKPLGVSTNSIALDGEKKEKYNTEKLAGITGRIGIATNSAVKASRFQSSNGDIAALTASATAAAGVVVDPAMYGRSGLEEEEAMHRELVEIEREISTIRRLHHNSCSQFVEALRTPDEFVIVMNMGKGCLDTRRYLQMYGSPSEIRVALILYQLVGTVNYLQQCEGLIHRDIKLENVLLSRLDISRNQIRQVLGEDIVEETQRTANNREPETYNTQEEEEDEGEEEGETKEKKTSSSSSSKQYRKNRGDANKPYTHSSSTWGTFSYRKRPEELDQLLKVTLIDFGLARRTARRPDKYRGRNTQEGNLQRSGLQRSSSISNRGIRGGGMPTPMPSAVNIFVSVDSESSSCASSTSNTPSVTSASSIASSSLSSSPSSSFSSSSSCSSLDYAPLVNEATETNANTNATTNNNNNSNSNNGNGNDMPASMEEGNGGNSEELARVPMDVLFSTGDVPFTTGESETGAVSISRDMLTEIYATHQDFLLSAEVDVTSMRDINSRPAEEGLNPTTVPDIPISHNTQISDVIQPMCSAENTDGRQRSHREEPLEDGDSMLFLTPCGTDKYLPPEMLRWIVSYGWERKPTPVRLARKLDSYAIGIVAYVLLSGCFPFNGASRASMAQQQQRCTPKCNSEHWKHISNDAISFVQSLLEPDPEVRSSVSEALQHPWLRRVTRLAEKLGLVPMPEDELHFSGKAFHYTTSASQSTQQQQQSQQRTSTQGHECTNTTQRYNDPFHFRNSNRSTQDSISREDSIYTTQQKRRTTSYLTSHNLDTPNSVALTPAMFGEKGGGNRELYTTTTTTPTMTPSRTTPMTQAIKHEKDNPKHVAVSPVVQTLSPVTKSPPTTTPMATELLAQIAVAQVLKRDDVTTTTTTTTTTMGKTIGVEKGNAKPTHMFKSLGKNKKDREESEEKEVEGEVEDDDDPFTRMFKTVMSE